MNEQLQPFDDDPITIKDSDTLDMLERRMFSKQPHVPFNLTASKKKKKKGVTWHGHHYDVNPWAICNSTTGGKNEAGEEAFERCVHHVKEKSSASTKPAIFCETFYRLPTDEELADINNYHLTAKDIVSGFGYTIIGRGIRSPENCKKILSSVQMLCNKYPENKVYQEALQHAKERFGDQL